jgi:diaminopimelate decarboxylase
MERFNSNLRTWKISCKRSRGLLAKVNVVKQTTSTVFAGIDSGFNHLIRPMLYGSHHIENISNERKERFTLLLATSVKRTLC